MVAIWARACLGADRPLRLSRHSRIHSVASYSSICVFRFEYVASPPVGLSFSDQLSDLTVITECSDVRG